MTTYRAFGTSPSLKIMVFSATTFFAVRSERARSASSCTPANSGIFLRSTGTGSWSALSPDTNPLPGFQHFGDGAADGDLRQGRSQLLGRLLLGDQLLCNFE